jgi:hypothetical protein
MKGKVKNLSELAVKVKAKLFIKSSGKKWTPKLEELFNYTWAKRIPKEIKEKFLTSKKSPVTPKIKPNMTYKNNKKELDDEDIEIEINEPVANKPVRTQVKRNKVVEPEDIDDPIYDSPLEHIKPTVRFCSNCGESFLRSDAYPNMLLCPSCSKWAKDIFSINGVYATSTEVIDTNTTETENDKYNILKVKPLER